MKEIEKDWILKLSKEHKLMLGETILQEEKYGMWFRFIKVLLDAPISEGGISTEELDSIWKKYVKK